MSKNNDSTATTMSKNNDLITTPIFEMDDLTVDEMYDMNDSITTPIVNKIDYDELLKSVSVTRDMKDIKDFCNLIKWNPEVIVEKQDPKDYYCPLKELLTEKDVEYLITTTGGKKIFKTFIDSFSKDKK
jgi:hypothetical protein